MSAGEHTGNFPPSSFPSTFHNSLGICICTDHKHGDFSGFSHSPLFSTRNFDGPFFRGLWITNGKCQMPITCLWSHPRGKAHTLDVYLFLGISCFAIYARQTVNVNGTKYNKSSVLKQARGAVAFSQRQQLIYSTNDDSDKMNVIDMSMCFLAMKRCRGRWARSMGHDV